MVEGGGLENRFRASGRGFESYLLREKFARERGERIVMCGVMRAEECHKISSD